MDYGGRRRDMNVDGIGISRLGIGPIERRIGESIDRSWVIVPELVISKSVDLAGKKRGLTYVFCVPWCSDKAQVSLCQFDAEGIFVRAMIAHGGTQRGRVRLQLIRSLPFMQDSRPDASTRFAGPKIRLRLPTL